MRCSDLLKRLRLLLEQRFCITSIGLSRSFMRYVCRSFVVNPASEKTLYVLVPGVKWRLQYVGFIFFICAAKLRYTSVCCVGLSCGAVQMWVYCVSCGRRMNRIPHFLTSKYGIAPTISFSALWQNSTSHVLFSARVAASHHQCCAKSGISSPACSQICLYFSWLVFTIVGVNLFC